MEKPTIYGETGTERCDEGQRDFKEGMSRHLGFVLMVVEGTGEN